MAQYYIHIAESEEWPRMAAAHPTSIESVTGAFNSPDQ
jgi:hypothetical protein